MKIWERDFNVKPDIDSEEKSYRRPMLENASEIIITMMDGAELTIIEHGVELYIYADRPINIHPKASNSMVIRFGEI